MLSGNQRLKLLLIVAAAQFGIPAVGFLTHYCYELSAIHQAVEDRAAADLAADSGAVLAAAGQWDLPAAAVEANRREAVRRYLAQQPQVAGVQWVFADDDGRIGDRVAPATMDGKSSGVAAGQLRWQEPPHQDETHPNRIRGTLSTPDGLHAAVGTRLGGEAGYLIAHRALSSVRLAPDVFARVLPIASLIAWGWTSVLAAIAMYMIVAQLYDDLSRRRAQAEADALRYVQSLVRTRDAVIFGLARVAESRDPMIGHHLERVSLYASRLAAAARRQPKFHDLLTPAFVEQIGVASMLHDIGKVSIEDWILFKPGPLSDTERARIQQHTAIGGRLLLELERRLGNTQILAMARQIARSHHERWDGQGYPDGLAGEATPLAARIVAVADVYEALSSLRDYKAPLAHARCMEIIRSEAGKHFDPDLAEIVVQIEDDFHNIARRHGDDLWTDPTTMTEALTPAGDDLCIGAVSVQAAMGQARDGRSARQPISGSADWPEIIETAEALLERE